MIPLAPTLYSRERVISNMFMVVMQYILEPEGRSRRNLLLQRPALDTIPRDVTQALKLLHGENFTLHISWVCKPSRKLKNGPSSNCGDLRESNVLYLRDKGHVLLVNLMLWIGVEKTGSLVV